MTLLQTLISQAPIPFWVPFLWLFIPGIFYFGAWLSQSLFSNRRSAYVYFGLSIFAWLELTHLVGFLMQDFYFGLGVSTLSLGLFGYGLKIKRGVKIPKLAPGRQVWIGVALFSLYAFSAIWFYDFHDKLVSVTGHFSITEQILNNSYPPRNTAFPKFYLNYHYGVDTLAASLSALTHLSVSLAFKIWSILFWVYIALLFGEVATAYFGSSSFVRLIGATLGLFAGGWPWGVSQQIPPPSVARGFLGMYEVTQSWIMGSLTCNFFQHPWTIGIPAFLIILLVLKKRNLRPEYALSLFSISFILFYLLAIGNTTLVLTVSGSMLGFLLLERKVKDIPILIALILALIGLVFTGGMASFLQTNLSSKSNLLWATGGISHTGFWNNLRWNCATFGLLIPLTVLGCGQIRKNRMFFVFMLAGCLLVLNVLKYRLTWDIVKFASAAQVVMALMATGGVVKLYSMRPWIGRIALFGSVILGFLYPLPYLLRMKEIPFARSVWAFEGIRSLPAAELEAMNWLRRNKRVDTIVVRDRKYCFYYATLAGLTQVLSDLNNLQFAFDAETIDSRERFIQNPHSDPQTLIDQRVEYVVVNTDPVEKDEFRPEAEYWLSLNKIREVRRFGSLVIYGRTEQSY